MNSFSKNILVCLAALPILLAAQPYRLTQYTVGDGLPQSQVYAVLEDSRGYLWLGTQGGGLARFDGREFKVFNTKNGLPGNYVHALEEDLDGNIWIGSNQGVCKFDGSKFHFFPLENGQDVPVFALAFFNGQLFAASQNGCYRIAEGNTEKQKTNDGQPFGRLTAAYRTGSDEIWVGGDEGLFKLEKDRWQTIQRRKAEVMAITGLPDGRILAGIFNSGILILDGKKRSYLNTQNGLPTNKVQCFWYDEHNHQVWIGLQDAGLCIWNLETGKIDQITVSQGLASQNIRAIHGDYWGKYTWLGTSGGGLCKYTRQRFEHYDTSDGLRSNFVYAVCEADTNLWVSAGDQGVSRWNPATGQRTHFDGSNGFFNVKCRALHHDPLGRIWIGTEGLGLAIYDGRDSLPLHFFSKRRGLAGNWIRDIATDPAGYVWVATTDGGLSRASYINQSLDNLRFENFGLAEGLPDLTVHALHFDRQGRLWLALQTGEVGLFDKGKISLLNRKNGLPGSTVRCLAEDSFGHLWVGTAGGGIGFVDIYNDKTLTFKQFDSTDKLASGNVYLLKYDSEGQLWVGTEKGVDRIWLDSVGNFQKVKYYGKSEGFLGVETCQNAVNSDSYGHWFGTMNGLMHFLPASDSIHGGAPFPIVTGVRLFYEPLENTQMALWSNNWGGLVDGAVFPYNQNHLGFEFFATDYANQERVMYSWQLVGQEADWSPFSPRTEVSYANLPPNEYRFRLRAKNEDGIISEPMEVAFAITPPFWQTWWFRLSAIGGALLVLWGWFRWRIAQVKAKAKQEKEQLELQNRLLTLEQKSRQLQMNPHFIFNALNGIQSLVTTGNMDSARQHILKFGRLMRAVLDNSRQQLIPLDKEVETLRQYLEMEQFCREGKFDFEIDTSGIESPDLQVPPMLLQPFVENAILHGIGPLSGKKGLISLIFTEKQTLLEVSILDNGIGIAQSQARKAGQESASQGASPRQSVGIAVTKERLELLRKETGLVEEAVEMRQLTGQDGEVTGTEVVVRMSV
ncbi:MAG: histidine kinase [Saprospiraceae bacterium]|nr:histidine kinase [Saprospiraceae bacterium]